MNIKFAIVTLSAAALLLASGCDNSGGHAAHDHTAADHQASPKLVASQNAKGYHCPMHPEVKSDKPAKCPKCSMKLVPIKD